MGNNTEKNGHFFQNLLWKEQKLNFSCRELRQNHETEVIKNFNFIKLRENFEKLVG